MNVNESTSGRPVALRSATHAGSSTGVTRQMLRELRHEVRQSVSTISGYTRLAGALIGPRDDVAQALETIRGNANHIVSVLDTFLGEHSPAAFNTNSTTNSNVGAHLGAIAAEIATTYLPAAQQRALGLHLMVATNLPEAPAALAASVRRILHNLVSNAVKYSDPGVIKLKLHRRDAPDAIVVRVENAKPSPTPADPRDERRTGLTSEGLGLSMVERLVNSLGGRLEFHATRRRGLTVEATLPLDIPPRLPGGSAAFQLPHRPSTRSSPRGAPPRRAPVHGHVVVVDGDTDNRRLAGFFLRRAGLDVSLFEHPAPLTSLDVARLDVAIVDLQGDELEGLSAAALLRDLGFRGPIMALSADEPAADVLLNGAGVDRVVSRKNSWSDLADLISRQIESLQAGRRSCETAHGRPAESSDSRWQPRKPK